MSKGYKYNYRKIWEEANGPIPKDELGRSYDIHHIDGNKNNNDLANLMCVTIQQHFDIHYKQGDYDACKAISLRMDNINFRGYHHSDETKSKIRNSHLSKKQNHWSKKPEFRKKVSEALKGEKNNNYGKFGELHHNYGKNWKLTEEQAAKRRGGNNPTSKKVIQYDLENNFIAEYSCIKEAKDKTGAATIIRCCKDYSKTSGGYKWKYK
jgi:hypothetical protein